MPPKVKRTKMRETIKLSDRYFRLLTNRRALVSHISKQNQEGSKLGYTEKQGTQKERKKQKLQILVNGT